MPVTAEASSSACLMNSLGFYVTAILTNILQYTVQCKLRYVYTGEEDCAGQQVIMSLIINKMLHIIEEFSYNKI